jgi:hypothetical protein
MENLFQVLTEASMKTTAFRDVRPYSLIKVTDVSKVLTASMIRTIIALTMEAVRNSETSVNFYETIWRSISALQPFHLIFCTNFPSPPSVLHNSIIYFL